MAWIHQVLPAEGFTYASYLKGEEEKSPPCFPTLPGGLTRCHCLMFDEFLQVHDRSQNVIRKVNIEGNPEGSVEDVAPLRRNQKIQIY